MVYTEWDILQRVLGTYPSRQRRCASGWLKGRLLRSQAGRAEKEMTHGYPY